MDSLSQISLGAAVGELVAGKRVGNKALLWGAIAGTIPDLDVLMSPFLNDIQRLVYHRGFSHSLVFAALCAPLLGWLIARMHRRSGTDWKLWTRLAFWCIATHPILDCFTTWGTQLFWPFSDLRVAFNSIFVIDPLYTLPLLTCVIATRFLKPGSRRRRITNMFGLGLSTAYLLLGVVNKSVVNRVFEKNLQAQHIAYNDYMTLPTPLNTILWTCIARTEQGFWQGMYSLLDDVETIALTYTPQNAHLLDPYEHDWEISKFKWITRGYYIVGLQDDGLVLNDMRFGRADIGLLQSDDYVFSYSVVPDANGNEVAVRRAPRRFYPLEDVLARFVARLRGKRDSGLPDPAWPGLDGDLETSQSAQ